MRKADLRVTKTIRAIKQAFQKLICLKPVNKISIAELAKEAEINKGTFYLHYADIYQLYDEMVVDTALELANQFDPYPSLFYAPDEFVRVFLFSKTEPPGAVTLAILKEDNLRFSASYPHCFIDAFREKIYAVGKLHPDRENDIKIEFILNGMISIFIKPGLIDSNDPACMEFIVGYFAGIVRYTFPDFYPQHPEHTHNKSMPG